MRKAAILDIFHGMRHAILALVALVGLVALCLAAPLAARWEAAALGDATEEALVSASYHDIEVQFSPGLDEDDLAQLGAIEGVQSVEAVYAATVRVQQDASSVEVRTQALTTSLNQVQLVEGSVPQQADEAALLLAWANRYGYAVGDTLDLAQVGADTSPLRSDNLRVTAIVATPDHLEQNLSGAFVASEATGVYLAEDAFDPAAFPEGKPLAFVRCANAEGLPLLDASYQNIVEPVRKRIDALGQTLASQRFASLHGDVQAQVNSTQAAADKDAADVAELERKVTEDQKAILEAQKRIDDLQKQIAEDEKKLTEGKASFERDNEAEEKKVDELKAKADEAAKAYDEAKKSSDEIQAAFDAHEVAHDVLQDAATKAKEAASSAEAQLAEFDAQLQAGELTQDERDQLAAAVNDSLDPFCSDLRDALASYAQTYAPSVLVPATASHANVADLLQAADEALTAGPDASLQLAQGSVKVSDLEAQLKELQSGTEAKKKELDEAAKTYNEAAEGHNALGTRYTSQTEDASKALEEKRNQLQLDEADLAQRKDELALAKLALAQGNESLDDSLTRLEQSKDQVERMRSYAWVVRSRAGNPGLVRMGGFMGALRGFGLAALPLLVACVALASHAAMAYVAQAESKGIGARKLAGMSPVQVRNRYLAYAAAVAVVGTLLAVPLALLAANLALAPLARDTFSLGLHSPALGILDLVVAFLGVLAIALTSALAACRHLVRTPALQLMGRTFAPTLQSYALEDRLWWQSLPLRWQVAVSNFLGHRRHAVGIACGCALTAALATCALTMVANVGTSQSRQQDHVTNFDALVMLDASQADAEGAATQELQSATDAQAPVLLATVDLTGTDDVPLMVRMVVPQKVKKFQYLCNLELTEGDKPNLQAAGVYLSESFAKATGTQAGDYVTLRATSGETHELLVAGLVRTYLPDISCVMGPDAYEHEFGTKLAPNAILARTASGDVGALQTALASSPATSEVVDVAAATAMGFYPLRTAVTTAAICLAALACLLAVTVLASLICARVAPEGRALAMLAASGASARDLRRLLADDSLLLAACGLLPGVALGSLAGSALCRSVEPPLYLLARGASLLALGGALVFGALVAAIVVLVVADRMSQRIDPAQANRNL